MMNITPKSHIMEIFDEVRYMDTTNDHHRVLTDYQNKPLVSIVIGQGIPKVIRHNNVEFTEPIVCQKIMIKGINCNPSDILFEIVSDTGQTLQVQSGDVISLGMNNWFSPSIYRIIANKGSIDYDNQEYMVAEFSVSWSSRGRNSSVKSDFTSLMAIQANENISLPKRSFWSFWSRLGTGINVELEEYRKTGRMHALPELTARSSSQMNITHMSQTDHLRGIRSVLEHGQDYQINALMYYLIGVTVDNPDKFRFSGEKMTDDVEFDKLIYDIGILYGYEYPISDEFILNFRN